MSAQGKKKLILMPSTAMDSNKKQDRNENSLVRMAAKARSFLGMHDDKVEVWTSGEDSSSAPASVLLDIFQAYAADLTQIKKSVQQGELKPSEASRIGFVTTKMYNRITGGGDEKKNIWISAGVHDTVMGADPEFLLFNSNGGVVHANSVMNKAGVIGSDGAMAEVRPKPSTTPSGLVKNIRDAFNNDSLTAPIIEYDWKCGCLYHDSRDYPMGGHIHIGNPAKVARMPLPKREVFFNVLNKIVDEMVALPCIRLDGEMGHKRRTNCSIGVTNCSSGWGWFGEWRTCNGRLEHRTLSGMWLMHPSVAKCVIGATKAITDAVFKYWAQHGFDENYIVPAKYKSYGRTDMNSSNFTHWKEFSVCKDMGAVMSSRDLKNGLNNSKGSEINKAFLDNWLVKMKRLETYSQYSEYIRGLREILLISMGEISKWDRKIQNNWVKSKKFLVNV